MTAARKDPSPEAQAFIDAARDGRLEPVAAALAAGMDPNTVARHGLHDDVTALMLAAEHGHAEMVRLLLDAGADPDRVSGDYVRDSELEGGGYHALQLALARGRRDAARLLIEAGARLSAGTGSPTPLQLAAGGELLRGTGCIGHADAELARLLLARGADPNEPDGIGQTALFTAAEYGELALVELLLEAGADPRLVDRHGRTALMEAAEAGHAAVVHRLVQAGADLEAAQGEPFDGMTALMWAAMRGREAAVAALLAAGAEIERTDRWSGWRRGSVGKTALGWAERAGHAAVAARLRAAGATSLGPPPEEPPGSELPEAERMARFRTCVRRMAKITGVEPQPCFDPDDDLDWGAVFRVPPGQARSLIEVYGPELSGCGFTLTTAEEAAGGAEVLALLPDPPE